MSESVFPYTLPCGSIVIDERCTCGAKRSEHNYRSGIAWGHGDCARTECERFTWEAFIYKPDDCEPISGTPISEDDAECAGGCEEHYLYCNCEPAERLCSDALFVDDCPCNRCDKLRREMARAELDARYDSPNDRESDEQ